jgi:diguanylate cyclase (GGDEF)-like protein/PAS domain S-box-containing protein
LPVDLLLGAGVTLPALAAATAGWAAHARKTRVVRLESDARRLWALTGDLLFEVTLEGRVHRASSAFAHELGYGPGSLTGRLLADLAHPDDVEDMLAAMNPLASGAGVRTFEARLRAADGWRMLRWRAEVDARAGAVYAAARAPGVPGERERAATALELALSASPIGMAIVTASGVIERVNATLCELLGEVESDVAGRRLDELIHPAHVAAQQEQVSRLLAGELAAVTMEVRMLGAGDRELDVTLAVSLVRDDAGEPTQYIVQVRDTSERHRLQQQVRYEAEHDSLTGLLNRRAFTSVLDHHVAYARRYRREGALIVLDVDGLREINETYGNAVGDSVLEHVAQGLRAEVRESDTVARLGGDEFAVMMPEIDAVAARRMTAQMLEGAGGGYVPVPGADPLLVTVSAGIALFGAQTASGEQLFSEADLALLEAKEEGPGLWVVFDGGVRDRRAARSSRRSWAEKLRSGLESDAFLLDAQPVVDLRSGDPVQYELLLRMRDDDGAIVRPNAFLYIAERYGLMRAIDEWVMRRAIALGRARIERGEPVTLAVNLSGESLADPALLPPIVTELMDAPEIGQHLVLEISERAAVADIDQARRLIARLGEFGCRFALDDFGKSNGSTSYLKHLPVDFLKLDGSFTRGLPDSPTEAKLVGAAVKTARGLGKEIIAECIEDEAILGAVQSFGIHLAQGLHLGRPGRASELLAVDGRELVPRV